DQESVFSLLHVGFRSQPDLVRQTTIRAMNELGETFIDQRLLSLAFQDPNEDVFSEALASGLINRILKELNSAQKKKILRRIRQSLSSNSAQIRCAAVQAVSTILKDQCLPELLQALADSDPSVKLAALDRLRNAVKELSEPITSALL